MLLGVSAFIVMFTCKVRTLQNMSGFYTDTHKLIEYLCAAQMMKRKYPATPARKANIWFRCALCLKSEYLSSIMSTELPSSTMWQL